MSDTNPLIGKVIIEVELADDKGALRFHIDDGEPVIVRAAGDCCSHTWIESLDTPQLLIGGTVTAVEDLDMPTPPNVKEDGYGDVTQYYGCKIRTNKGDCVIDFRNTSNGYYGGSLVWPHQGYFYGGVYGQNVSKEQWRRIAP